MRIARIALLAMTILSPAASQAQDCTGGIVKIDRLNSVLPTYPLYMKVGGQIFSFRGACIELSGRKYRGSIEFFVRNQFPEAMPFRVGAVYAQSIRKFGVDTQKRKIKVSRNEGWYEADGLGENTKPGAPIDDKVTPFAIDEWNRIHGSDVDPLVFSKKAGRSWHSYAKPEKDIYSAEEPEIWTLPEELDWSRHVATQYLIKFQVNTDSKHESKVPILVYTPEPVSEVRLRIRSNIGMLFADYRFVLTD